MTLNSQMQEIGCRIIPKTDKAMVDDVRYKISSLKDAPELIPPKTSNGFKRENVKRPVGGLIHA